MNRIMFLAILLLVGLVGLVRADKYDFSQPPAQALQTLTKLKHLSTGRQVIDRDEAALIEDARDGKFDQFSFAEAALIASGVTDREKRKNYLAQLARIEAEARQAVANAKTPAARGEKLLQFLHAGPMKQGYSADQSTLSGILDQGEFNCVSSTVLYNVIGRRLGLDLRAVLVPRHAFAVLKDQGKSIDVETTCERGFNPQDPDVQKEVAAKTGLEKVRYGEDRREIGELGLVATVYANRGVALSEEHKYYEALLVEFAALALDPHSETVVENTHASLLGWSKHLCEQVQHETAMAVLAVARPIAPKDDRLVSNRDYIWQEWITATHTGQSEEKARTLVRRLLKENPQEPGLQDVIRGHVVRGMKDLHEAKKFPDALAWVERHREILKDAEEFKDLKVAAHDAWAEDYMEAKKWQEAIQVYERALKEFPGDSHLENNLAFCRQENKK